MEKIYQKKKKKKPWNLQHHLQQPFLKYIQWKKKIFGKIIMRRTVMYLSCINTLHI